jgi:hypothetical protein
MPDTRVSSPYLLAGVTSPAAQEFLRSISAIPRFAHHPTCRCYDNHLIRIGSRSLCLGCTCVAVGATAMAAVLIALLMRGGASLWANGPWKLIGLGVLCYLPALGQLVIQQKFYKASSRFLLGCAVMLLLFGGLILLPLTASGWILRVTFIAMFCAVYKWTQVLRSRLSKNPCDNCTRGVFPFCEDNLRRGMSAIIDLQQHARPEDRPFVDLILRLTSGDERAVSHRRL